MIATRFQQYLGSLEFDLLNRQSTNFEIGPSAVLARYPHSSSPCSEPSKL